MNLYLVISETLTDIVWEDWFNYVGHEEAYCIAELVLANRPSQAKYLAWKNSKDYSHSIEEMPKFSYRTLVRDVEDGKGIVSNNPKYEEYWDGEEE